MDRIDAVRNMSGLSTVTTGSAITVGQNPTVQLLSENAIAIGAVCTMITCTVFVITGIWGLVLKHKQTDAYIECQIKKRGKY